MRFDDPTEGTVAHPRGPFNKLNMTQMSVMLRKQDTLTAHRCNFDALFRRQAIGRGNELLSIKLKCAASVSFPTNEESGDGTSGVGPSWCWALFFILLWQKVGGNTVVRAISAVRNKNVNEWSDSEKRIEARLARDQAKLAEIRRRKYSKSTPRRLHVPAIESSIVRLMLTLSSGATTGASSETNRSTYAARLPPLFRSRTSQITLTTTGTSSSPRAFLWVKKKKKKKKDS
jgi:hypothetical protein